jgi:hypothetical protein
MVGIAPSPARRALSYVDIADHVTITAAAVVPGHPAGCLFGTFPARRTDGSARAGLDGLAERILSWKSSKSAKKKR